MRLLITRRKHKRGERGSIEEDQSSSKRANKASKENDPVEEETEEPSRLELKEILVDIKIDVSNILRENAKLTKELAELRSLIKGANYWPFIMKTLDYFNFGSDMKRWVSTFYTNIESTVLNNGFATNWFKSSKGVRQGCPLSPYLFILSAEILDIRK